MFQSNADSYDRIAADWAQKRDSKPLTIAYANLPRVSPPADACLILAAAPGAPIDVFLSESGFDVAGNRRFRKDD